MTERPHPADWADAVALDVISDVMGQKYTIGELRLLIAVRLRCERAKGHVEGLLASGQRPTMHDVLASRTPDEHAADMTVLSDFGRGIAKRGHERHLARRKLLLDIITDEQADHDDTVLAGHPGFAGVGA